MWGLLRVFSEFAHSDAYVEPHHTIESDLVVMSIAAVTDVRDSGSSTAYTGAHVQEQTALEFVGPLAIK